VSGLPAAAVGVGIAAVLAGLWLVIVGLMRRPPATKVRNRLTLVRGAGKATERRRRMTAWVGAGVAGLAVWVLSGWPVAAALVPVGVLGVPYFFNASAIAARRIERLEALEEWVRRLADAMAAGSAPVQTIVRSAARAPAPIRPAVEQLASRLASPRHDRREALLGFATDLDDSLGDTVALALDIAVSAQASQKVPEVLRLLAAEVADDVRARRKVEADRAGPRNEARIIVVVQVLFVAAVCAFTSYAQVYATAAGQLILAAFGAAAVFALWLMRRFGLGAQPPRILPRAGWSG
jgi:Flp pilus assembly protein TadB